MFIVQTIANIVQREEAKVLAMGLYFLLFLVAALPSLTSIQMAGKSSLS